MEGYKMEYIYAAMLLHKAGHKIEEGAIKKILEAANVKVDDARAKALVATLEGVDIEKAIAAQAVAAAPAAAAAHAKEEKKSEEKPEEKKKTDEQAAAGLGALFG